MDIHTQVPVWGISTFPFQLPIICIMLTTYAQLIIECVEHGCPWVWWHLSTGYPQVINRLCTELSTGMNTMYDDDLNQPYAKPLLQYLHIAFFATLEPRSPQSLTTTTFLYICTPKTIYNTAESVLCFNIFTTIKTISL